MTKPAPVDKTKLLKLLEKLGYINRTQGGTYMVFERPGNIKKIMIRQQSELTPALLKDVLAKVSDQTEIPVEDLKNMMNEL